MKTLVLSLLILLSHFSAFTRSVRADDISGQTACSLYSDAEDGTDEIPVVSSDSLLSWLSSDLGLDSLLFEGVQDDADRGKPICENGAFWNELKRLCVGFFSCKLKPEAAAEREAQGDSRPFCRWLCGKIKPTPFFCVAKCMAAIRSPKLVCPTLIQSLKDKFCGKKRKPTVQSTISPTPGEAYRPGQITP